jgi:hypothetical protein
MCGVVLLLLKDACCDAQVASFNVPVADYTLYHACGLQVTL